MTPLALKIQRELLGLSRKQLAKTAGYSWRTIEAIEQGRRPVPEPLVLMLDVLVKKQK